MALKKWMLPALFVLFAGMGCSSENAGGKHDSVNDTAHGDGHEHAEKGPGIKPSFADSVIGSLAKTSTDTVQLEPLPPVYDGDLIFQTWDTERSKAIKKATNSKYSHVGIIFLRPRGSEYIVYEAWDSVRMVPLQQYVDRGEGKHILIMRMKGANKFFNAKKLEKIKAVAKKYRKLPYDPYFGWGDDRMYCSELVWKTFHEATNMRLSEPKALKLLDLSDPELKKRLKEKYGEKIPMEELVVSPQDLIDSPLLEKVYER